MANVMEIIRSINDSYESDTGFLTSNETRLKISIVSLASALFLFMLV